MLPFLKRQQEGSMSEPIEPIKFSDKDDMDYLDACAHDILMAMEAKDAKMLKEALMLLVEHIKEEDEIQDHREMK